MHRAVFLLFAFALASGSAGAQASSTADQKQMVQALLARIEKLERRVEELEAKRNDPPPTPASIDARLALPSRPAEDSATTRRDSAVTAGAHVGHAQIPPTDATYPSLQFRGFMDVDFAALDQKGLPSSSGFRLGQFVLHLTSPLSKKISFFGETSFTARPDGFALEVERSVIRYDYNDYFKISFGRYHTPISYWNTAYHHGLWLQTTIDRPEMIQFGGRFIPVHFVGLLTEGVIPSAGLGLNYSAGVGNGRGSIISRAGDAGDINNNRAWLVNLFARPSRFYGLEVGGSVYGDKLSPGTGPVTRELITSAHVVWAKENPEFLAEFANVRHRVLSTAQSVNSQAFYVQVGYRLPWQDKRWKPYYRFEHTRIPASEPIFNLAVNSVQPLVSSTVGLRYDISDYAAFKGEYRNFRRYADDRRINGLFIQTSFTF